MKPFKIFIKDLKRIIKNPAAIAIILGLCIIPSFYTWITLKANWNPYVDTGNVPVAVVNDDMGTIINNQIVNFGDQTVDQLKHNNTIKWTFVGDQVAEQGLKDGQYYAVIIIPSDFSNDLKTVYTGDPTKPDLIYKVNEKTNAIATKITDIAASQLQGQIKQQFFDGVNKVVLNEANKLGDNIHENQPMILNIKNVISNTNSNVENIINNINSSNNNINQLSSYMSELKNDLPSITNQVNNLQGVISASKYLLQSTQSNISNIKGNLDSTNSSMQNTNNSLNAAIADLKNVMATQTTINSNSLNTASSVANKTDSAVNKVNNQTNKVVDDGKQVKTDINNKVDNTIKKVIPSGTNVNQVKDKLTLSKEQIKQIEEQLVKIASLNKNLGSLINAESQLINTLNSISGGNTSLSSLASSLNNIASTVNEENTQINDLTNSLNSQNGTTASLVNDKLNQISGLSSEITQMLGNFTNNYSNNISTSMSSLNTNITNSLNNIDGILIASKDLVPQLNQIASVGISSSNLTVNKAEELKGKLDGLKSTLSSLQSKTSSLTNSSLNSLVNLLEKNPQQLSSLLSSPVGINVQELYGMSIFGVGLAPFYTVLSIWVGALLCTTILSVEDKKEENGTKKRILEIHFGKMLLFLAINLIQTTIVTVGDVFLIGIKPQSFWLLMAFAWFSSLVFTVIIFTLVSLNGNFGKAAALVIMVVQVAGSGAIYPIQVNPAFFQKIEFLWPFKYAIDGFRQAIGGADWSQVTYDFSMLAVFLVLFIIIGMSKMIIHKVTNFVEEQFKASEL